MHPIYLVARRDYLAYVGALGFWISLITAPLLVAAIAFAPILLARAEPPRLLLVHAERAVDGEAVQSAFERLARHEARGDVAGYIAAAAPAVLSDAMQAFDAAPDRASAIEAARAIVAERASGALRAFPSPSPRYLTAPAPSGEIETLRAYLTGARAIESEGHERRAFGALVVTREAGAPSIAYWSANLSHDEPSAIARDALARVMRHEALAEHGLSAAQSDAVDALSPRVARFDPRPSAGEGQVTLRQRAPFYAALFLAFVLWSAVFSVANLLLTGIIEEKSNKILDTLLTSLSPLELLIGKLLGAAAVSATLFAVWGLIGGGLISVLLGRGGDGAIAQVAAAFLEPRLIAAFVAGFVAGFLMYGAIFVAIGSLCETVQESQTLLGPVALVLALPMLMVAPAIENPNAPIIEAASWFPLFTPFLILIRAPAGLSWLEIVGLLLVMAVSLVFVLRFAARLFRAGVVDQANLATLRRKFLPGRGKSANKRAA